MPYGETTTPEIERVGAAVVDSCYVVHKKFGPGLLESVYEVCFCHELRKRRVETEPKSLFPSFTTACGSTRAFVLTCWPKAE